MPSSRSPDAFPAALPRGVRTAAWALVAGALLLLGYDLWLWTPSRVAVERVPGTHGEWLVRLRFDRSPTEARASSPSFTEAPR
ncbi:MAG TPA: hypothetical protein VF457_14830 [Burkholderiaceae bacterium]